jgi:3-deoxy-manno-octulosonate cytidylyltransferase (CMP-KDO synthetase)
MQGALRTPVGKNIHARAKGCGRDNSPHGFVIVRRLHRIRNFRIIMSALVIIPARMSATRLPDKPLKDIAGQSMIARVYRQALKARDVRVVVAAGDAEIYDEISGISGEAVMTDPALPSGSDRIMAALRQVDPKGEHELVINLQGDMPFVDPGVIDRTIGLLNANPRCDIATLVAPELSEADRANKDVVKAVLAQNGRALYFTRSTLFGDDPVWRHIGIYGYRRSALEAFTSAPPSPLEIREKLEQLRALEMGLEIWALSVDDAPLSVDTPDDLKAAIAYARAKGV